MVRCDTTVDTRGSSGKGRADRVGWREAGGLAQLLCCGADSCPSK